MGGSLGVHVRAARRACVVGTDAATSNQSPALDLFSAGASDVVQAALARPRPAPDPVLLTRCPPADPGVPRSSSSPTTIGGRLPVGS